MLPLDHLHIGECSPQKAFPDCLKSDGYVRDIEPVLSGFLMTTPEIIVAEQFPCLFCYCSGRVHKPYPVSYDLLEQGFQ